MDSQVVEWAVALMQQEINQYNFLLLMHSLFGTNVLRIYHRDTRSTKLIHQAKITKRQSKYALCTLVKNCSKSQYRCRFIHVACMMTSVELSWVCQPHAMLRVITVVAVGRTLNTWISIWQRWEALLTHTKWDTDMTQQWRDNKDTMQRYKRYNTDDDDI